MNTNRLLMGMLMLWVAVATHAQGFAIDPTKPVSAADVEVTAMNYAIFEKDSIRVVAPEDLDMAWEQGNALDLPFTGNNKCPTHDYLPHYQCRGATSQSWR